MNVCMFMGNLTRDPEIRTFGDNKSVTNFGLAINRSYKKGDDWVNEPSFLDCELWDKGGEIFANKFKKGDMVIVQCSVKQDNWEDKTTGEKRSKLKFRVDKFEGLPGKKKDKAIPANDEPATTLADTSAPEDEQIPF